MFKYRLITTCILFPIIVAILFLTSLAWFSFITMIICVLSSWEWSKLINIYSYNKRIIITVLYGLLMMFMMSFMLTNHTYNKILFIKIILLISLVWWLLASFMILSYPYSTILWRDSEILKMIFGVMIILPFFEGILILRQCQYDNNSFIGSWLVLYIMMLVWGIDSGAYIFGRIIGRYKLVSNISPNKTWEGLLGGIFTAMIIMWLFNKSILLNIPSDKLFIYSIISILASIIGDLTESMLKREAGIKDSSNLLPGHGGILDRIDSLTAAVPVFTYLNITNF